MIPVSRIFTEDSDKLNATLSDMYEELANGINGDEGIWTPTVEGATTKGAVTYSGQVGYFYRRGLMVDCWFSVTWSAHSGTGDLQVRLPFKIKKSEEIWVGTVSDTDLLYTGYTHLVLRGASDSFYTKILASATATTSAYVAVDAAAGLNGYIRYIGQEEV